MKRNGVSSANCNIGTQSPVKAGGGLIQTVLILGKLLNTFWVNVISSTSDIQVLVYNILSYVHILPRIGTICTFLSSKLI